MTNLRISDLVELSAPNHATDYVMVLRVAQSDLVKVLIEDILPIDDDFYNALSTATQVISSDSLLIWYSSAGGYRKIPQGVYTAPEVTALKGWFLGGSVTGTASAICDRLNIATETCASIAGMVLSQARFGLASITWSDAQVGYQFGGSTSGVVVWATCCKTNLKAETTVAYPQADMFQGRYLHAGGGNGTTHGYLSGGYRSYEYDDTEKFTFATELCVRTDSAILSVARQGPTWLTHEFYAGYILGGATSGPGYVASCDKINYSTDTSSVPGFVLTLAREKTASGGDNTTKGYILGGYTGGNVDTADRLTYATETCAYISSANLITNRRAMSGISQGGTYVYVSGGFDAADSSVTERLVIATETTAVVAGGAITTARQMLTSNSEVYW